jgi:hypothetical protein
MAAHHTETTMFMEPDKVSEHLNLVAQALSEVA